MPSNKEALIEKHGSEKAYKAWLSEIGRKGGKRKVKKGFSMRPDLAKKYGGNNRRKDKK